VQKGYLKTKDIYSSYVYTNNMKENLTYIQITKDTRKLLQQIKLTKRESYDEIINRLIKRGDTNE